MAKGERIRSSRRLEEERAKKGTLLIVMMHKLDKQLAVGRTLFTKTRTVHASRQLQALNYRASVIHRWLSKQNIGFCGFCRELNPLKHPKTSTLQMASRKVVWHSLCWHAASIKHRKFPLNVFWCCCHQIAHFHAVLLCFLLKVKVNRCRKTTKKKKRIFLILKRRQEMKNLFLFFPVTRIWFFSL